MGKAIARQIPRFTLAPTQSADVLQNYPKIVSQAQANEFTEDMIHTARQMPVADRMKWVTEQIGRLDDPSEQGRAWLEVNHRHVLIEIPSRSTKPQSSTQPVERDRMFA